MLLRDGDNVRLAHAALLLATDEYDDIAPARYLERLNGLAERVDVSNVYTGSDRVEALRVVLIESESYRGNYEDFQNPANHYLNRVIDTHRGIPISLSAVWLDLARQLDWPFHGVSMPGHFLIRYDGIGEEIIVDPFNGGRELSHEQCEQMVKGIFGPDFVLADDHLAPIGTKTMLTRMLGNMYSMYAQKQDWLRCVRVLRRVVAVHPEESMLHSELGRMQFVAGDLKSAANTLTRALELASNDEEEATANTHLHELRQLVSEQN